jgi:hypothetical protein
MPADMEVQSQFMSDMESVQSELTMRSVMEGEARVYS